jgi:hypothetical protein
MMYCFLCDRPAYASIQVIWKRGDSSRFAKPRDPGETLDVCVDCVRRVEKVEYDITTGTHVVYLRSLT